MSQWKCAGWVWVVWVVAFCGLCVDVTYGQFHWIPTTGGLFTKNTNWIQGASGMPGADATQWASLSFALYGQTGNVTFPDTVSPYKVSSLQIYPSGGQAPLLLMTCPIEAETSLQISALGGVYPLIVTQGASVGYGSFSSKGQGDPCLGPLTGNCLNVQANIQALQTFILESTTISTNLYYMGQLDIGSGGASFKAVGDIYFDPSSTVNFGGNGHILTFHVNDIVPDHPSDVAFTVGNVNSYSPNAAISLENVGSSPTAVLRLNGTTTVSNGATLTIQEGINYGLLACENLGTVNVQANAAFSVRLPKFTTSATSSINLAASTSVLTLTSTEDSGNVFTVGGISGGQVSIEVDATITGAQNSAFTISGPVTGTFNGATKDCSFSCTGNCNTNFGGTATHSGSTISVGTGTWTVQAPMSGAHFTLNGGTLTVSGTCTGCSFTGTPGSLTITGSIPQSTINLSGGTSAISGTGAQSITLSGGTHTISGSGANNPITVSGTAQVTFQNAQATNGQITVSGGSATTSGTTTFTKTAVTISGGTFSAASMTSSGSTWTVSGGSLTTSASSFSGDSLAITATLSASGGSFANITATCTGTASCNFGDSAVTSANVTVSDSAALSGSTVVLSSLYWYGGNLAFQGTAHATTLAPSSSASITGQVTIAGPISWTGGDVPVGSSAVAGTLTLASSAILSRASGHIVGIFGVLYVQGNISCAGITANLVYLQGGTIDLSGGTLQTTSIQFSGGTVINTPIVATTTGQVVSNNPTTLQNSSFSGTYLQQTGPLNLVSTTLVCAYGKSMQLDGPITSTPDSMIINNGTLTHSSANGTVLSINVQNSGVFKNSGDLTINGNFLCVGGTIQTDASSTFAFSGPPLTLTTACTLKGAGTFSFRSDTSLLANLAAASVEVAGKVSFTIQNILNLKFTSGSMNGDALNVSALAWTSGTLNVTSTTSQSAVLGGGNMQLEGEMNIGSLNDTVAANEVLSSSSGHTMTVSATQIAGTLVLNNVRLDNRGTINVALNGSLTVNGVFSCGAAAQQLNVLGYFAINSLNQTSLACTTSGTGTLATYSQLSIATSFGISNLLIANTSFAVNQPVNLVGLILNSSSIVGTNTLTVSKLSVGPGQSTMSNVALTISSAGTFDGSLALNNVTLDCHAAITLNANGVFSIGGSYVLPSTCVVSGPGVLASTGNLTIGYRITVGGLSATGGSLNLTAGGNYTFSSLALNNSHLIGNIDTVTITNTASFTSTAFNNKLVLNGSSTTFSGTNVFGYISNTGSLTINDGQHTVTTFLNSGSVTLATSSTGQKRATTTGTLVIISQFNMTSGTVVFNGGELQATNSSLFTVASGEMSGTGTFINSGSVVIYSPQHMDGVEFDNYGSVKVMNNTTSIGGGGTLAGTILVAGGAELDLSGGVFVLTNAGSISGNGTLTSAATLTLNGNLGLQSVNVENGTIDFVANVFSGVMSWTGGAINTLSLASGSVMKVTTNGTKSLGSTLTNNGAMAISGPVTFGNQASLVNYGSIVFDGYSPIGITDNLLGNVVGNLTNHGSMQVAYNASGVYIQTTLTNYGSFLISAPTGLPSSSHIGPDASIVLIGSPVVTSSKLSLTSNATLAGSGTVTGTVYNSGLMYVGNVTGTAPGSLTFNNLDQSATGILFMDVFDFGAFDSLTVNGELTLVDKVSVIVIDARVDISSSASASLLMISTGKRDGQWVEVYPDHDEGGLRYTSTTISFVIKSLSSTTQTSGSDARTSVSPGLSGPKIAGIVIGVVVGILIIAAIAVFIVLRRKDKEVAIKMEALEPEAAPTEQDALEYSFDFFTYSVSHKDHSRMNHVLQLHDMLIEDNLLLVDTLVAVTDAKDGESINNVARSLTYLLETKRMFLTWFERMLQEEVNNCLSKETLFRGNNMFTKAPATCKPPS